MRCGPVFVALDEKYHRQPKKLSSSGRLRYTVTIQAINRAREGARPTNGGDIMTTSTGRGLKALIAPIAIVAPEIEVLAAFAPR